MLGSFLSLMWGMPLVSMSLFLASHWVSWAGKGRSCIFACRSSNASPGNTRSVPMFHLRDDLRQPVAVARSAGIGVDGFGGFAAGVGHTGCLRGGVAHAGIGQGLCRG